MVAGLVSLAESEGQLQPKW